MVVVVAAYWDPVDAEAIVVSLLAATGLNLLLSSLGFEVGQQAIDKIRSRHFAAPSFLAVD